MHSFLIILIIFVKLSLNSQLIPTDSYNLTHVLNKSLQFGNNQSITFATSSARVEEFNELLKNHQPHIIYNFNKSNHKRLKINHINYDFYIIFDRDLINIKQTLSKLLLINNLNVHGKYFVIIQELLNRSDIVATFEYLFKQFDIYNIILLNNATFFTWYPYTDNNCNKNITIHKVDRTDLLENFVNKLPKKLNNCKFRISPNSGSRKLIEHIADALNATFISPINGTFFDLYGKNLQDMNNKMSKKNYIMAINPYIFNVSGTSQHSMVIVHEVRGILLLPPRRLIPKWQEFKVFSNQMILAITITIIISGLVYALMTKCTLIESFFRMYQLCLQLSLNMLPKDWILRIYVMFLLFFVMIISSGYLSVLSGVFTRPSLEPKITNLQELFDSDIRIKLRTIELEILKSKVIENKRKPWPKEKFIMSRAPMSLYDKNDNYSIYTSVFGRPKSIFQDSEVVPDTMEISYYYFFYRKRLHLNNLINYNLRIIDEMGFIQNYYENINLIILRSKPRLGIKLLTHENVTVLTMVDLSGVFIIWLFGLAFSTIAFIFEIINYKREMKLRRILRH